MNGVIENDLAVKLAEPFVHSSHFNLIRYYIFGTYRELGDFEERALVTLTTLYQHTIKLWLLIYDLGNMLTDDLKFIIRPNRY